MSGPRGDIAPWWTYWLHNFPHINLRLQPAESAFKPQDEEYQQTLVFFSCLAAACLGLNLLLLAVHLSFLCCCGSEEDEEEEEVKRPKSCCVTWSAVVAGLLTCVAVGLGFYGNSEINDGVHHVTYSMYNANHTLGGVQRLVTVTMATLRSGPQQHLQRLDEIFSTRGDFVQSLRFMEQMTDSVVKQLLGLPDWARAETDLSHVAQSVAHLEYYRWLSYLLLLILDLIICLLACLGLVKRSRRLLTTMMVCGVVALILSWASLGADLATAVGTSDFCVAPETFLMSQTHGIVGGDIVHYYLYCNQTRTNPFQQPLAIFQRSMTTMQIQIQGLLQFAVPLFPTAERDLLGIQKVLNFSESSLHQLTALLDCRGLNKDYVDAMFGVCYDGVEGVLFLCLFSLLSAMAFTLMLCAVSRAWRQMSGRETGSRDVDEDDPFNPRARRTNVLQQSLCSYSSGLSGQSSLHRPPPPAAAPAAAAAGAAAAAAAAEHMNHTALFGGTPRYENVPLIGRGSPPPSYSPTMRASYLSMTEDQSRHRHT
ncbi:protein tweety homolog 2 isoform X2 [Eucyclogobius newberryi]|uniref:protein tweety homolog 2 isoform X2 n=1 Tax=Eucyclogobius newberryi TaxID=166745 RepID=UPI003B5CD4AC